MLITTKLERGEGFYGEVTVTCEYCKQPFKVSPSRKNTARFCSIGCRNKGYVGRTFRRGGKRLPSKKELKHLYHDENLTLEELSSTYGAKTRYWAYYRLKKLGISRRSVRNTKLLKQGVNCELPKKYYSFINEDVIFNYILKNKEEFGYINIIIRRTPEYDFLGVRNDGSLEKVEIEVCASNFFSHNHKCDKIISYFRDKRMETLKKPIVYLNKGKFLPFLSQLMVVLNNADKH